MTNRDNAEQLTWVAHALHFNVKMQLWDCRLFGVFILPGALLKNPQQAMFAP